MPVPQVNISHHTPQALYYKNADKTAILILLLCRIYDTTANDNVYYKKTALSQRWTKHPAESTLEFTQELATKSHATL